jgi:hypothetical protein
MLPLRCTVGDRTGQKKIGNLMNKNLRKSHTPIIIIRNNLMLDKNLVNTATTKKVKMVLKISMRRTSTNRLATKMKEVTPNRTKKGTNMMTEINTTKRKGSHGSIIK